MKLLKRALDGEYVTFGVFALYNDDALETAVRSVVNLILSVPFHEILVSFINSINSVFNNIKIVFF